MTDSEPDVARVLVGLTATLNAAGMDVGPDRLLQLVRALAVLDPGSRSHLWAAARSTLCAGPADFHTVDRALRAVFDGELPREELAVLPPATVMVATEEPQERTGERDESEENQDVVTEATVSDLEMLRRRDIAEMDERERGDLARLLATFDLIGDVRRTRRHAPSRGGEVDPRATMREMLRSAGEPVRLRHRTHRYRPRRIVLLVDVSGSMNPYTDALLRFAHAGCRRRGNGPPSSRSEAFTLGTRLTRVTGELAVRDPDSAMAAVGSAVNDWSGGTRLGELLKEFLDRWGRRSMARGAVVVVISDGWECGDTRLLGEQMASLSRLTHRVVWANPRKGRVGYRPLVGGMAAALPHVDDFVAGHSIEALEHLARVITLGSRPPGSDRAAA